MHARILKTKEAELRPLRRAVWRALRRPEIVKASRGSWKYSRQQRGFISLAGGRGRRSSGGGGGGGPATTFFGATLPTLPSEFTTPTLATAPTATGKGRYYTPGLVGSPDAAQSLQQCIDDAATQTGVNVIVLAAGTTYTTASSYVLKPHAASWTYIISSDAPELVPYSGASGAGYASFTGGLPAVGTRVNNTANSLTASGANDISHMAKMATSDASNGGYIIMQETAANGDGRPIAIANHYKFVGIDFSLTEGNRPGGTGVMYFTIALFNSAGVLSGHNNLTWERCHMAGAPTSGVTHIISCSGSYIEITESYLWRAHHGSGSAEAHCFFATTGVGPYKFTNTFWEAYGIHIIIGGGNIVSASLIPSDIVVRGSTFKQNPTEVARPEVGGGKDFVEFKCGKRILVESNYFGYSAFNSPQGQIHIMVADQTPGGNPWLELSDVTIQKNTIFGGVNNNQGGFVQVACASADGGSPTGYIDAGDNHSPCYPTARILVRNNLGFMPTIVPGSSIAFVIAGSPFDLVIDHNTFLTNGGTWNAHLRYNDNATSVMTRAVYTNNITSFDSTYGFWSATHANSPLTFGNMVEPHFHNNAWGTPGVAIGGVFANAYPAALGAFGFVDSTFATVAGCALAGGSAYKGVGVTGANLPYSSAGVSDGSDIGANIALCPTG